MSAIDLVMAEHIRQLAAQGKRVDARGDFDFRPISIAAGIIDNAEGSAEVDMGGTQVLAGVKVDLGEPMSDTPDRGNLSVSAELLPMASPDYEAGPPSPTAIELARVVDRGIRAAECIDLESLFIEEGKVWSVWIDLYVLNYSGNLIDAAGLAAMAALNTCRVPKYEDGKAVREDRSKRLKIDNIVTSTTFGKINGRAFLDTSAEEEAAVDGRLTIQTDGELIRAMQKGLSGGFSVQEVSDLVDRSFEAHTNLKEYITKASK
ncbi:MAG: exosome complex protein Rrp42 [Candidatus Micrarchaeota archaeon]|nr:exosome complex protein Rrp42 [Candidatus Micrarchaeota archaeon]